MEPKPDANSLGTSLLVPCVQEMVKGPLTAVPPQYLQTDLEPAVEALVLSIPVIDFQKLLSEEFMDSEVAQLDTACRDWGFFLLVNHGVRSSLVEKLKAGIQDFFNQSMEKKKKYWQFPGEVEGFGQAFVVSEEQKLDWGDIFYMVTLPAHMRKPHLFPELPQTFRDTLEVYSLEMKNLAMIMFGKMADALKIDVKEMERLFDGGRQAMRMNYYPPCPQPEKAIGLTPHSDTSGLTILLQVSDVEGLQIRKDGTWLPVTPLPGAFIINIGDILEIVSNGAYRSIEHRATVNSKKERLSIATFCSPTMDAEIRPSCGLIGTKNPALYRTVVFRDYLRGQFTQQLAGKSYVSSFRIAGSE